MWDFLSPFKKVAVWGAFILTGAYAINHDWLHRSGVADAASTATSGVTSVIGKGFTSLTEVSPEQRKIDAAKAAKDADDKKIKAQQDIEASKDESEAAKKQAEANQLEIEATKARLQTAKDKAEAGKTKDDLDRIQATPDTTNVTPPPSGSTQGTLPGQTVNPQGWRTFSSPSQPSQVAGDTRKWHAEMSGDAQSCTVYPLNADAVKGRDGIAYIVFNRGMATFNMLDNKDPIKATSTEMWTMIPKTDRNGHRVARKDGEIEYQLIHRDESTPSSATIRRDYNESNSECNAVSGKAPSGNNGRPASTRYAVYPTYVR